MNPKEEEKGPLIGSIIVILVLVLGAVYILANKKTVEQPVAEQPAETVDATATGPSDEVADIEAELQTTRLPRRKHRHTRERSDRSVDYVFIKPRCLREQRGLPQQPRNPRPLYYKNLSPI